MPFNSTLKALIESGSRMTNQSNFTSFAKRLQRLPVRDMEYVLYHIKDHHDEQGTSNVYAKIKTHANIPQPMNMNNNPLTYPEVPIGMVPPEPRAAFYNVAYLPNCTETVTVGKTVYTKKKKDPYWIPRYRNTRRKQRANRKTTRKARK